MIFGSRRQLSMTVKPKDVSLIKEAIDEATVALRSARRLKPKQADNFGVFTSDTILDIYHSATNGIFAVLVGVVGLSLVVGGIVIMNIMLMAVSERTREIGIRKALGARRRDILAQFVVEAAALSSAGAVLGIGLGLILAWVVNALTPLPAAVAPWSVAVGVVLGVTVGIAAGVYPASRASRLDPIVALRAE